MAIPASTYLVVLSSWPVVRDERFDPLLPSPWRGITIPLTSDPLHPVIAILFNHGIDPAVYASDSALGTYFLLTSLTDPSARNITDFQNVHFDVLSNVLTFQTLNPLVLGSTYGATVRSSLRDAAGRGLERAYYWEFETEPTTYQSVPTPILLSPPDQTVVSEYPFDFTWGMDSLTLEEGQQLVFLVSAYDSREKNNTLWSSTVVATDTIPGSLNAPTDPPVPTVPPTTEQFLSLQQQILQLGELFMSNFKNQAAYNGKFTTVPITATSTLTKPTMPTTYLVNSSTPVVVTLYASTGDQTPIEFINKGTGVVTFAYPTTPAQTGPTLSNISLNNEDIQDFLEAASNSWSA